MAAAGMRLVPPASRHSSVLDLSSMMAPPFGRHADPTFVSNTGRILIKEHGGEKLNILIVFGQVVLEQDKSG